MAFALTAPADAGAAAAADELLGRLFGNSTDGSSHAAPYPLYAALRDVAPVHHSSRDGVWYVSRHADCLAVLLDPAGGRKPVGAHGRRPFFVSPPLAHVFTRRARQTMLWSNPPDHGRLRRLASGAFTASRIDRLQARITALVDECLDAMLDAGEADAMEDFAFRFPIRVVGELVGVPAADHEGLRAHFGSSVISGRPDVEGRAVARAEQDDAAIEAYFIDLVAHRRRRPGDDLLSDLVRARDGDDRLTEDELLSTVSLLFGAGFITTSNLIGNGLLALLRHPAEMARLWADPALAAPAVEEILRYDSPVQFNGRYLFDPIDVSGTVIPAGEFVLTLTGGANRDPARFSDPERFDVGRADNHPLSFGWGIHHCLGARLARLEGQIALRRLAERLRSIELLDHDPPRAPGFFLRGLRSLPVRLQPR
jgi:cytochrome P450